MSLLLFYMPSLGQALKSSSIYEFSLVQYAQLQPQLQNLAQYTRLVLFYIHSYSPSFEIQPNIRVQYYAICLALVLALKSSSVYEFSLVLDAQIQFSIKIWLNILVQTCSICLILTQALKSSSIYEFIIGLYVQLQL